MTTTLMTQVLQSITLPKIFCRQDFHVRNGSKYSEDEKLVKRTDRNLQISNMFKMYAYMLQIMAITDPQG